MRVATLVPCPDKSRLCVRFVRYIRDCCHRNVDRDRHLLRRSTSRTLFSFVCFIPNFIDEADRINSEFQHATLCLVPPIRRGLSKQRRVAGRYIHSPTESGARAAERHHRTFLDSLIGIVRSPDCFQTFDFPTTGKPSPSRKYSETATPPRLFLIRQNPSCFNR